MRRPCGAPRGAGRGGAQGGAARRRTSTPHLAAYRERREKEGLTEGAVEVEIYRSLTD